MRLQDLYSTTTDKVIEDQITSSQTKLRPIRQQPCTNYVLYFDCVFHWNIPVRKEVGQRECGATYDECVLLVCETSETTLHLNQIEHKIAKFCCSLQSKVYDDPSLLD